MRPEGFDDPTYIAHLETQLYALKAETLRAFRTLLGYDPRRTCRDPSCARSFLATRSDTFYCSPRCRNRLNKRNHRARREHSEHYVPDPPTLVTASKVPKP